MSKIDPVTIYLLDEFALTGEPNKVDVMVKARDIARANKDWFLADAIRLKLGSMAIKVMDYEALSIGVDQGRILDGVDYVEYRKRFEAEYRKHLGRDDAAGNNQEEVER